MKLLLDEMLPATIAEQLRRGDHDAVAVTERRELRGLPDADLFEHAQHEQRTIVTYNRDDFLELDRRYRRQGREHHGVVIINPRSFPEGAATVGPLLTSLRQLLAGGAPYPAFVHWLQAPA